MKTTRTMLRIGEGDKRMDLEVAFGEDDKPTEIAMGEDGEIMAAEDVLRCAAVLQHLGLHHCCIEHGLYRPSSTGYRCPLCDAERLAKGQAA